MTRLFATLTFLTVLLFNNAVQAGPDNTKRIQPWQMVTGIPKTSLDTLGTAFSKDAIIPWSVIAGTTAITYAYDREMLDEVQRWGRSTGIGNADNTKSVLEVGPYPIFRFPSDTGSALYFLGDGWTHFSIGAAFLITGQLGAGNRPHNTGYEIFHGMVVSTLFSQFLKRTTGRESPSEVTSSSSKGKWRPFPDPVKYGQNTPKYDAFPSGHVMTATLTFTIINENYPEYSHITIPIGVTWVSLLGLQMMNNGVHWASDYPLGIAIGYVVGKMASRLGEPDQTTAPNGEEKVSYRPVFYPGEFDGTSTFNLLWRFR